MPVKTARSIFSSKASLRPRARRSAWASCQRGVLRGWLHALPHVGLGSGGKKEKSGHGMSWEMVLAVGEKTGGMAWPWPNMRAICAASRGISMIG